LFDRHLRRFADFLGDDKAIVVLDDAGDSTGSRRTSAFRTPGIDRRTGEAPLRASVQGWVGTCPSRSVAFAHRLCAGGDTRCAIAYLAYSASSSTTLTDPPRAEVAVVPRSEA
jgi:hypothetical protein